MSLYLDWYTHTITKLLGVNSIVIIIDIVHLKPGVYNYNSTVTGLTNTKTVELLQTHQQNTSYITIVSDIAFQIWPFITGRLILFFQMVYYHGTACRPVGS